MTLSERKSNFKPTPGSTYEIMEVVPIYAYVFMNQKIKQLCRILHPDGHVSVMVLDSILIRLLTGTGAPADILRRCLHNYVVSYLLDCYDVHSSRLGGSLR